MSASEVGEATDRRQRRTQLAITTAFSQLFLEKGYDEFGVGEIISRADVARSTFYQHFAGKEDVLRQVVSPLLAPIAGCVHDNGRPPHLHMVLSHLWENRKLAHALFAWSGRTAVERTLNQLFSDEIEKLGDGPYPRTIVVAGLTGIALALLQAWLSGRHRCNPEEMAEALHRGVQGGARGLIRARLDQE